MPDEIRGKLVKCQHCQTMFRVPQARTPEPVGPASSAASAKSK